MGRVRICGPSTGDLSQFQSTGGTISATTNNYFGNGNEIRTNPTTTGVGWAKLTAIDSTGAHSSGTGSFSSGDFYCAFKMRIATLPASSSEEFAAFLSSTSGDKVRLRLNSSGNILIYNSPGSLEVTSSGTLSTGTVYLVEVKIVNGTTGSCEVKIDGSSFVSDSSMNTGTTAVCQINLGKTTNRNGQSVDYHFGQIVVDDAEYPGDTDVYSMDIDGAGNYSGATSGTYASVDERPPNSDTDYLGFVSNTNRHSAALESASSAGISGTIKAVQTWLIGRDVGSVSVNHIGFIRENSTDTNAGSGSNPGTSYTMMGQKLFTVAPSDSAAFEIADLDGLEIGAYMSASNSKEQRVTNLGVEVEFFLSGAISGTADMVFAAGSSTLTGSGALAGTAAEVFGAGSSTLTGVGALAGSSALIFADGSSVLSGSGALAGSGAMVFGSGSSTLVGAGALVGVSDLVFGAGSSTLVGSGALAGSSTLTFVATGTLDLPVSDIAGTAALVFGAGSSTLAGAGALTGASALVFTDSGALTGGGDLAGVVTITFDDGASTLVGSGSLAGQVDIVFDDGSSTLTGAGALAGVAALTFDAGSTTLIGTGALAGTTALTFTIAGTLTVPSGVLAGTATITLTATGLLSSDNFLLAKRYTFPQQSTCGVVESRPTADAFPPNDNNGIFELRQTKGKLTPRPATGTLGGP